MLQLRVEVARNALAGLVLMRKNLLRVLSRNHLPAIAAIALFPLASCDWMQVRDHHEEVHKRFAAAHAKRDQRACASNRTYDRLKDVAFNRAIGIRNTNAANLDKLATYSLIRMENPRVKSRDERLDVTVCEGRFVLYLPQGAERWFGGETSLEADVEYTAQMAADGSGLIYQLNGADPIIYRLAAFDLQGHKYEPPKEEVERFAQAHLPAAPAAPPGAPPSHPVQPMAAPQGQIPAATLAAAPAKAPPAQKAVATSPAAPPAKPAGLVQAVAVPAPKPSAPKPIPAAVAPLPKASAPSRANGAEAPKHRVQIAQALPPRPSEPKGRKGVVKREAESVRRSAAEERALAAALTAHGSKQPVQLAAAEPHHGAKPAGHRAEKRKPGPMQVAAHAPLVRAKPAVAVPRAPSKKPVQIARAAPPKPAPRLVRKASQTFGSASPAPPKARVAVAPAKPSLLARLPGLAALFAAPQPAARKPAPAAAPPPVPAPAHAAAPVRDQSIAASRSTKLADQADRNPNPRLSPPVRVSAPIAPRDDCADGRSRGEEMLCENGRLASLDRSVQRLYDAALGAADGEARYQLQRTKQRFLAYLDSCRTESCLARVYQVRMNEIRQIMAQE